MHDIRSALHSATRRLIAISSQDDSLRHEIHHLAEVVFSLTANAPSSDEMASEPLDEIIEHCSLKAEGARWAAARQRLFAQSADYSKQIEPLDQELLQRAREIGCHLWTNTRTFQASIADLEILGGCFEAVATVCS